MQLSLKDAWTRILDDAQREVPEKDFKAWVEPAKPVALENDRLVLGVPDEFAVQWNEAKNASMFARLAERALGRPVSVVFRVDEERLARPQMDFFVAPPPAVAGTPGVGRPAGAPGRPRPIRCHPGVRQPCPRRGRTPRAMTINELAALIVAMVLSAQEPWYVAPVTSAVAILSKYVFRSRAGNVFNPAALALVLTHHLFETGQSWWGALPEVTPLAQLALVVAGVFITDRVNRMYFAQCLKDETMAESIARAWQPGRLVVHYNGSFHSDFRRGTAARVRRRLPDAKTSVLTVVPVANLDTVDPASSERKRADYLIYVLKPPAQPAP